MQLPDDLQRLLRNQDGLVHRVQLREHGITDDAVRWALGRTWQFVLPGVVAAFTGRLTTYQQLVAGALFAGEGATVAATTAARWHGITTLPRTDHLRFQVPARRQARHAGQVVVARTHRPDPAPWDRSPLTISSPARAVADAARLLRTPDDVTAVVIEAVQRGVTSLAALRHELEAGGRNHSALLRRALASAELGVWSLPESGLESVLAQSRRLPYPMANPVLLSADGRRLPTPDLWFDEVALVVQVHSVRWHALAADWEGTVMKDSAYVEHGIAVIAFTPGRILAEPGWVRERVERVHDGLLSRPRPDVTAEPRIALVRG